MQIHPYFSDYITGTARMAVLKSKAACTCKLHPDTLILSQDTIAQKRAYMIATNTLVYHDKMFLKQDMIDAVGYELNAANTECVHCLQNKQD
jgi:hypothetical protein